MTRQEKVLEKKKLGRPAIGKGVQVNMQLRPTHAEALDKWREAQAPPIPSRAQAAKHAIAEWLTGLGLLKTSTEVSHPEPTGPATEVVKEMDGAIARDRDQKDRRK